MQVDVSDAAGKPLADAVIFLDSAEARKQVKPLAGVEMAQEKRQFIARCSAGGAGGHRGAVSHCHDTVRHHVPILISPASEVRAQISTAARRQPRAV